ncbi:MAG: type II secretion system F family protein [Nitrospira sp.]|jgi:type IV pilus assembly protein PilC|uniref:type II secretion system F family protein n=1 Tax=Nitrospira sp. ND1 TaxID=1658518 RepID=UPI0009BA192F|nr:type II secretion system F family protein [Nitrospira sp. ND1]MBK7418988.1 type II secretion system F family protein [Nitrospira sp.]OYT22723.1 MAG: pilus assembly protein PilC [Nitrospira sp. UW-LDO-02]MBK8377387.1 type II secretion system F family protein [Nitrospira sp.]MBK9997800.1 type II secretion system F family protein [Nitrospira sp.]MBP6200391.1 type II secretion system F family protein [Nitrospira sp.]
MSTFAYVGRNRQGAVKKGELTAKTRDEAVDQLRKQQVVVTSLEEKSGMGGKFKFSLGSGLTDKDLVVFTRQFGTMINAGLPLIQCLDILSTQSENKVLRETVGDVKNSVEAGSTFSDALKRHPKVFDDLYVNMIHAGEVGGLLDTILTRLAKHIEKAMKLKGQIKSAMVYPTAIVGVAVIIISVLMVWVIPVFAQMFLEMSGGKVGLPGPTQIVINVSNFFQSYWYAMGGAMVAAAIAIKRYYATVNGRVVIDRLLLKVPIVGDLIRKASVAKFTRTLGTLITSGVPLLEGLSICAKTSGNKVIEEALMNARVSISGGKTISEPLAKCNVFPKMVTHMIAVGESTGALDAMLGKIADFYEDEVDQAVETLTSLLEPIMMVVLGTIIGFIVIAMYLPIFTMAQAIQ